MPVTVTLHVFSGRPDPTWELDEKQVDELQILLVASNQEAASATVDDPGNSADPLGYRGFSIKSHGVPNLEPLIFVSGGSSSITAKTILEGWLLSTAGNTLDKEITNHVKERIKHAAAVANPASYKPALASMVVSSNARRTASPPPIKIAIDHDDYAARYVGRTKDGKQFFLTTPFVPAMDNEPGTEFVALFLFDDDGNLVESNVENFGPRATMDQAKSKATITRWIEELGDLDYERIEIKPFALERFGYSIGLIAEQNAAGEWLVSMLPGDYMVFFEPWDSGFYDT